MYIKQILPPWNVLFFGSDKFSLEHLKCLKNNCELYGKKVIKNVEICLSSIHKNVVYDYGKINNIKMHNWPPTISKGDYDVGVVVSFGHLIPQNLINSFHYGILNVHPSILPQWRGATPIHHSVLNDDLELGISLMHIQANKFDKGPCLIQKKYAAPEHCFTSQLQEYLAEEGSKLLLEALTNLPIILMNRKNQSEHGVTCAHKIKKINVLNVDWLNQSASQIYTQYRAFGCQMGVQSFWNKDPIKLLNIIPPNELRDEVFKRFKESEFGEVSNDIAGSVFYLKKYSCLCIQCKDSLIGFREIVYKKHMTAKSFFNGYLSKNKNCTFASTSNQIFKYMYKKCI